MATFGRACLVSCAKPRKLATTSQWKDKATGERREETEWHCVVMYNRLAEIAGEYLRKGRPVYIEGRLKTRKWQDKDTGADRNSTEIVAVQMYMLGGRESESGGNESRTPPQRSGQPRTSRPAPSRPPQQRETASTGYSANLADMDDDIPF